MSEIPSDLEQLRRRIDEIDDRLQDLLVERINIVSRVAAHKRGGDGLAAHQPAREAGIIRRLISRNHDPFPPATLVRMWRELLAATTRLQGAFTIAVYAPPDAQGFWDLARPLRQPYADADLPVDRAGHPRGDRGPGGDRRAADAAGRGSRPVVAPSLVDPRQGAARHCPAAVRCARQHPLRQRRRAGDRPWRPARDRAGPHA